MSEHRWSGWPGAWCLDCGIADPIEECLASHEDDEEKFVPCPDHPLKPCEKAGEGLFDPYRAAL